MMARMPELSSRLTSPAVKPSRLSISSCDRTRSPPFLPEPKSRLPSSTIAANCRAIDSVNSLAAAASAAPAGSSLSSEASHWAAIASWSPGSLPAMILRPVPLLNDDFLEQHRADRDRRDRCVDPAGQFLLEPEQARGAVEVGRAQFAHVGLEDVGDARHRGLDRLDLLLFLDLEHDLHFQILHAFAGGADQVDQHVRHLDEGRRFRHHHLGMLLLVVMAEEKKPGRGAAADDGERADDDDDEFELALGRGGGLGAIRRSAVLFILSHGPSIRCTNEPECRQAGLNYAIQMPPAQNALSMLNATVTMVNGTFLLLERWEKVAGQTWSTSPYCRVGRASVDNQLIE